MLLGKSNQSSIAVLIALQHEEEINEKNPVRGAHFDNDRDGLPFGDRLCGELNRG